MSASRALHLLSRPPKPPSIWTLASEQKIAQRLKHLNCPSIRPYPSIGRTSQSIHSFRGRPQPARHAGPRQLKQSGFTRYNSSRPNPDPTPHLNSPEPALSLSQRLKALSKEYGWTALGVYLGLSALDFPFCFLAVRTLGTERIARWEHAIIDAFWSVLSVPFPSLGKQIGEAQASEGSVAVQHPAGHGETATIWTQLALAYAVHKSLIVFRVPLTAAVLPKVVKTLRSWGYNVGRKSSKQIKS